jgi:hypothetical protein
MELFGTSQWSPAELYGRIKVVLAEGISRAQGQVERYRDVVAFSFQHAPLGKAPLQHGPMDLVDIAS